MPESHTALIETWTQGYEAWRTLLEATEHSLWALDADLSGIHPDRGDWPDTLHACVRRLAPGQVRLLVKDERTVLSRMPRTRQILIDYGHIVELRKLAPQHAKTVKQSVVISDAKHIFLRPGSDTPRAFLRLDDAGDCARHLPTLQESWDCSTPVSVGSVLGL